jgi:hypothetical protein
MKEEQGFYSRINKIAGQDGSGNGEGGNNIGHPTNWDDDQYITFAKRWIQELARMTEWRDNPKADPPFSSEKELVERLATFPEPFLQECVRYRTAIEYIEPWLKLGQEQRYQKAKQEWSEHDCSVDKLYGNTYASPEKPGCSQDDGCIPECRYYAVTGTVQDDEVLTWYRDIIGDRTYEQLKTDNNQFLQDFAKLLKKQASELPTNTPYRRDYFEVYYPSIMDI